MSKIRINQWENKFSIAKEYYKEYGHLNVPDKFIYKDTNLGNWIYLQRKNYRDGNLSSDQIERLNAMKMRWDVLEETWEKKYEVAKRFYESNGSLLVPATQKYENVYLGKWISHQRQSYVKGQLAIDKIKKLEQIGMIWDASKSNVASSFPEQALFYYLRQVYPDTINRCLEFKYEIDIYIPSLHTGIEYDGFAWHQNIKKDIEKNHKLDECEIRMIRIREKGCPILPDNSKCIVFNINRGYTNLAEVIFEVITYLFGKCDVDIDLMRDQMQITSNYINIYNTQWEKMYQKVKAFYDKTGELPYRTNSELGGWLSHQRQRYKHKGVALTADQIEKLNALGMMWEPHKDMWKRMYTLANKYYEKNGHLNLTVNEEYEDIKLGGWISSQRTLRKKGKLSTKNIALLDQIGMIWDAQVDYDKCWEDKFYEAKAYYEKRGDLRINTRTSALGRWINGQRCMYTNGELVQERVEKLNSIGMVWNIYEKDWDMMYELAYKYFEEKGHINLKSEERYCDQNLGSWIKRQCVGKEDLTPSQIARLEKLNIVWKRRETKWDKMFNLAKRYYEQNGNLLINTHSMYEGERLGQWINKQRTEYMYIGTSKANGEFSAERIRALEDIGMVWDVNVYKWNCMYDVAKQYYDLYGNLKVSPSREFEGVKLGKWISNQRSAYRGYEGRKPLTADQIEKLNEISMIW